MKIFIVNDHDVFRQSLKQFIENYLHYEVIGESSDGKDFLDIGYTTADIILMDINMPFVNGLDAAKLALWKNSFYKIIAISLEKDLTLTKLIYSGFKGFVSKLDIFEQLDTAIKVVMNGGVYYHQDFKIR